VSPCIRATCCDGQRGEVRAWRELAPASCIAGARLLAGPRLGAPQVNRREQRRCGQSDVALLHGLTRSSLIRAGHSPRPQPQLTFASSPPPLHSFVQIVRAAASERSCFDRASAYSNMSAPAAKHVDPSVNPWLEDASASSSASSTAAGSASSAAAASSSFSQSDIAVAALPSAAVSVSAASLHHAIVEGQHEHKGGDQEASTNITLTAKWKTNSYDVSIPITATVGFLKTQLALLTDVRTFHQKLVIPKVTKLTDDLLVSSFNLKPGTKFMLIGNPEEDMIRDDAEKGGDVVDDLDYDYHDQAAELLALQSDPAVRKKMETTWTAIKDTFTLINPIRPGKKLLVLDLDYTLFDMHVSRGVHQRPRIVCEREQLLKMCFFLLLSVSSLQGNQEESNWTNLRRPYCHRFLTACYAEYDLVVWSVPTRLWRCTFLSTATSAEFRVCSFLQVPDLVASPGAEADAAGHPNPPGLPHLLRHGQRPDVPHRIEAGRRLAAQAPREAARADLAQVSALERDQHRARGRPRTQLRPERTIRPADHAVQGQPPGARDRPGPQAARAISRRHREAARPLEAGSLAVEEETHGRGTEVDRVALLAAFLPP
jgi:hypothetical protein